ncbi:MAG TPA: glycosyltransferase family 39 protein, partial [bacterium]|nr:glycosyltransferase family 39 protein [bacterium]
AWAQILLVLGGLILPLGFMLWRFSKRLPRETAPCFLESFPTSGPWIWVIPGLAAVLARFWAVTTLLVWPQADEGFSGIAGIELSRHWDWRFFYSDGQSPPVLDWICALFFKSGDSYFFNLWFPPAVFSVLTLVLGYLAARQYFSRSFSWFLAGLIAFSFWPLYLGRLCLQVVLFPPWEMASFWALGKCLKARHSSRVRWACGLGFIVGLGAYTYVPWVFIPALVSLVLLFEKGFPKRESFRNFFIYLLFLVVGASWFIFSCFREGYGDHISSLWAGKTTFSWAHHLGVVFDYFNILFWGFVGEVPRYIPFQGGYLNPFLGALFFLGLAEAWRFRNLPLIRVLATASALFLLPGVLSTNVQGLRIVPLMPLALFLAAFGFQSLTKAWMPSNRFGLAVVLLFATAGLDGHRLFQPYLNPGEYDATFRKIDKNPALFHAYESLLPRSRESGLVFTDFTPERDQTLRGATYPFNAAWNQSLVPGHSHWAAILALKSDVALLSQRFPKAVWTELGPGSQGVGDLALGIIQVTHENDVVLMEWAGVPFRYFQGLSSAMNEVKNRKTYDDAQDQFAHPPQEVTGDPFLKACLERRTAEFYDHFGRH